MAEITPMMKQYLEIKEQNKDSILFFRLGDFYEMFNEDAQLASRELDLTLTTRDRGKAAEDQTPMCGIPYHSSDAYIARLIAKGYKVAICEQTEDPALAKGLVKRDIIRVITPGTVIDSACLDDRRGNFLCGIFLDGQNAGAAFCDMTTGHTHVTAFSGDDRAEHLYNELSRFSPAEAVLSAGAYDNGELVEYLRDKLSCAVERGENRFELKACEKAIRAQFGEERFASLPRNNPAAALALGALLSYLHETQKTDLSYIKDLEYYEQGRFMELDLSARRNLELTETIRAKEKRGGLLWVLDKTKTAMGAQSARVADAPAARCCGHRAPPRRGRGADEEHRRARRADSIALWHQRHGAPHRPHCLRHGGRARLCVAAQLHRAHHGGQSPAYGVHDGQAA